MKIILMLVVSTGLVSTGLCDEGRKTTEGERSKSTEISDKDGKNSSKSNKDKEDHPESEVPHWHKPVPCSP